MTTKRVAKPRDERRKLEKEFKRALAEWSKLRDSTPVYPLLIEPRSIGYALVDEVFQDLRDNYGPAGGRLDVIVHSGGGDIDPAYNLAQLFRRYGTKQLEFVIPRWAKSAATMLICAGDRILMSPVAELGPLDPQITEMNPLEGRMERFSPLHIGAAIDLIRDEYNQGNEKLAEGLLKRLQFPITLGSYRSMVKIGQEYVTKLLSTRMLAGKSDTVATIARQLTTGYVDHGFCIGIEEAISLGLVAQELTGAHLDLAWKIYQLSSQIKELDRQERQKRLKEELKDIPPGILEKIPDLSERLLDRERRQQ